MREDSVKYGIEEEADNTASGESRSLSASEKRSLLLILASIALWYFGYNAVTSKYAVYAGNILDKDYNTTMLLAQAAAIVAYLPAGTVASKFGRKKTILGGVVMLASAFGCAAFMRASSPTWMMNLMFILAGVAWATINVNSFPMVVEMCSGADIGKYTGFYYTASMSAQIATPMLSGFLMDKMGMTVLFPYAAIFVALAFMTMTQVRHGDAKITAKKGLEALDIDD
jgi:MFS family permease